MTSLLNLDTFRPIPEVARLRILLPEFFTPLGQDPKYLRAMYADISAVDLFLSIIRYMFWYFPADQVVGIFFNLSLIFFLLF